MEKIDDHKSGQNEVERERKEESYIFLEKKEEQENHDYLEAIIDTGCGSSICGEK